MMNKIATIWRQLLPPMRGALLAFAALALAALLAVACGGGQEEGPSPTAMATATAVATPVATASPLATAVPTVTAQDLTERGPFAVGVSTLTLVDESRPTDPNGSYPGADSRTLVTEVWYPAEGRTQASELRDAPLDLSQAPYPLIVFSHGLTGVRRQSTFYTEHLASHGYIVISPDYPLSNGLAPGGPRAGDVLNQPGDVSFLIDSFLGFSDEPGNQFEGAIDETAIGLTGHSLGGLTTLLATFGPLADPRVKAAVPLAPVSCLVGSQNYEGSRTPLLVISGSDDQVVAFESARQAYDDANPPKYLLELLGGNHLRFADGDLPDFPLGTLETIGGATFVEDALRIIQATGADPTACPVAEAHPQTLSGDRQQELTRLFATAFFDYYLKGDEGTSYVLTAEFAQTIPEVELEIGQPSSE
jgi:predicted dienelactone hydrolase